MITLLFSLNVDRREAFQVPRALRTVSALLSPACVSSMDADGSLIPLVNRCTPAVATVITAMEACERPAFALFSMSSEKLCFFLRGNKTAPERENRDRGLATAPDISQLADCTYFTRLSIFEIRNRLRVLWNRISPPSSIDTVLIGIILHFAILRCHSPRQKKTTKMECWTFLSLLLLGNFAFSLSSFAEEIIAHVHVAANEHWMVFARNRDEHFHFTLSPYQTPTEILHLNYTSLGIDTVRSLSIPAHPSPLDPIELVFIGGSRNSSERLLFHVKLRKDETHRLSLVHLEKTSITSLSSPGIESALGVHPLGTYACVIGDQAGYIYDLNESRGYPWSSWQESIDEHYPKAVSVTTDHYLIVATNVQLIDTIVPGLYISQLDPQDKVATPLNGLTQVNDVEVTSIRAPMSLAVLGSIDKDYFALIVGFPSADTVFLSVLLNGKRIVDTAHESREKGINFGQVVIFGDNNTYGVLSTALTTSPWSTGRVQVRCLLFAAR